MRPLIRITLISFFLFTLPLFSAFANAVSFTAKTVDLNFNIIPTSAGLDFTIPAVLDVDQLVVGAGVESRNTSHVDENVLTPGDTSEIDGVFVVDNFKNPLGQVIFGTNINITWEMTGTYVSLSDQIFEVDSSKFSFLTIPQVGILTFYVSTDMTQRANPSTGQGYTDGVIVAQYAVFNPQPDPTTNLSGGVMKLTNTYDGSRDMIMMWQTGYPDFVTSTTGTEEMTALLTDQNLDADSNSDGIPANSSVPANWSPPTTVNWPFSFFTENDGSIRFGTVPVPPDDSCRMTGGGHDYNGNLVLGTYATSEDDRYTYGGQVGAPTADQPQPSGEWTHHQFKGDGDKFIFRSGTASAPKDTKIDNVYCQDPCNCVQARPAPFKQISWDGTGHFANISPLGLEWMSDICNAEPIVLNKGQSKKNVVVSPVDSIEISAGQDGSRHYYRVHVNDLGEPGSGGVDVNRGKGKKSTRTECPLSGQLGDGLDQSDWPYPAYEITPEECENCPDTYQIEIHCTTDPASDVMYSVGAFVEGGNLQIHPPVGDSLKPGECIDNN